MNKKGEMSLGVIVMLFVGIIVALALLTPIFNTQNQMTSKQVETNKSYAVTTAYVDANEVDETINYTLYTQSVWKQASCDLGSVVIRNGIGDVLTITTDYLVYTDAGVFSLVNTSDTVPATTLNLTYADFNFCADGYNTNSGARSIAGIIGLFAALALMAFVLIGIKNEIF